MRRVGRTGSHREDLPIKIKPGLLCLFVLPVSWDQILPSVLDQARAGLVVREGDAVFRTLRSEIQNPREIARAGIRAGLSACGYGSYSNPQN